MLKELHVTYSLFDLIHIKNCVVFQLCLTSDEKCNMKISKLFPACKNYIWDGNELKEKYGKKTDKTPWSKSWE